MYSHVLTTSSSIIRRHGRVRFTAVISTGDRMVLSHFCQLTVCPLPLPLPFLHVSPPLVPLSCATFATTRWSPRLFVPPLPLSQLPLPPLNFRLQRLPVGGLSARVSVPRTSGWPGQNQVVIETLDRATPSDTPPTQHGRPPYSDSFPAIS